MKLYFFITVLLCSLGANSQVYQEDFASASFASLELPPQATAGNAIPICPVKETRWKMNRNKYWTGGLMLMAGAAKGFNEGLQYQYNGFAKIFPGANKQWFYPGHSFRNKYKDGDPAKGPKFLFSTSLLVMVTDQYHLNNFIQRASITSALVIKIGEGKRPLKHYLFDMLYYTACYQAGFHSVYAPIRHKNRRK
jgi:hypothetical protein